MKYESAILKRLIDTYGVVGNPKYISEIIKEFIVRGKECFPNLFTYQADWLAHIDEFGLSPSYTVSYTGQSIYAPNTLERPVKSAILKGSTKYRDIDTGEFLETFEEDRNLELVSVKMPVLTTSNEDGTKTNILTVNEEVELRGIGGVKDELDLLTSEMTQRIGEIVFSSSDDFQYLSEQDDGNFSSFVFIKDINRTSGYNGEICDRLKRLTNYLANENGIYYYGSDGRLEIRLDTTNFISRDLNGLNDYLSKNPITLQYFLTTPTVKTVDLTILDQNGQTVKQLMSFNGGTHFNTMCSEGSPLPTIEVSVETDLEETLAVCSLEGNTM